MVYAGPIPRAAGAVPFSRVSGGRPWQPHVLLPRLRALRLPAGAVSTRLLLARRDSALESLQLLRPPAPRAVEHHVPLPRRAHLPARSDAVGAGPVQSRAPHARRRGGVSPRSPLDQQPLRRVRRRPGLRLQRLHPPRRHVAEQHRRARLGTVALAAGGASVQGRRKNPPARRVGRCDADAGGRAGSHPVHLGHCRAARADRRQKANGKRQK